MCKVEFGRSDVRKLMAGEEVRIWHGGEFVEVSLSDDGKEEVVDYVRTP